MADRRDDLTLLLDVIADASVALARSLVRVCIVVLFLVCAANLLSVSQAAFVAGDVFGGVAAASVCVVGLVLLPHVTASLIRHPARRSRL
jgi:hypothetical protein